MIPNKNFKYPLLVTNLNEASKPEVVKNFEKGLFITSTEERAKQVGIELEKLTNNSVLFYPKKDFIFYSADVRSKDITKKRLECIDSILKDNYSFIVLCIDALFDKLCKIETFKNLTEVIKISNILETDTFAQKLSNLGYERVDKVEFMGQFAIRGGIIDFFPLTESMAIRIELFDNEIDSIRSLDVLSQRSVEKLESVTLTPAEEPPSEGDISLINYLSEDSFIIADEPNMLIAHSVETFNQYYDTTKKPLTEINDRLLDPEKIISHINSRNLVLLNNFTTSIKDFTVNEIFKVDSSLIAEFEVIKPKRQIRKKRAQGSVIQNFTDLKVGDYIVHDNHGIGIYSGIETIITDGIKKDYIKLNYADEGKLYIPTNQLDRVQKYLGGKTKLNKIGSVVWERTKKRARESAEKLAREIALLYAKRKEARGFSHTKDTVWQTEFEEKFGFEETYDQLEAIKEVKKDMESTKIMDRLICGDVGFGKTEVAIRAAFKAVDSGKQVAFLCPTTILATQHFNTFKSRMEDYPITIELLSRFRTKKEQKESVERIKTKKADIVIGTHRILSKDVNFSDLGLVIIDEEQRFGITHKENLKNLTINVDVLTLTATPIPRTLHMSLSGIRDISLLTEPPMERKTIQTFVLEEEDEFIKIAISREISRKGQVYYLHNRVINIEAKAKKLREMFPNINIEIAHGQMSENELEDVMISFIEGEIDVLICTTIIETGLDIPNVNTIIIENADTMGLSQLYQLRGRVGRSDRIAYSYLMYKKDKVLTEVAAARLQTIRDFTEFGSGFKVALKDLEIRGVGNLLGPEQSGHMAAIGFDLYNKFLEEALLEERGERINRIQTNVEINITAYLPDYYIKTEDDRLEIYKKIFHISSREEYDNMWDEMVDRFGDLPKTAINLLSIAFIKAMANKIGINKIEQRKNTLIGTFSDKTLVDVNSIIEASKNSKNILFTTSGMKPYISYKSLDKEDEISEEDVTNFANILENIKES